MGSKGKQLVLDSLVFLILANLLLKVSGQDWYCVNTDNNYPSNGTFSTNLNNVFSSLSTNMNASGFNHASFGQAPDTVHGVAICRGDIPLDSCRTCVHNASVYLLQLCPSERQAILWNLTCMLRYSNEPILGILQTMPGLQPRSLLSVNNPRDEFMATLRTLLDGLRLRAAYGGNSSLKVGAGTSRVPNSLQPIYALAQCTPDLSPDDCNSCLANGTDDLSTCCDGSIGARILRPSCFLRYEITTFFDAGRLQQLGPVYIPPSGNDNNARAVIITIISVSVGAVVILAMVVAFFARRRIIKVETEIEDDISLLESIQYDFEKIRDATNDFSEANKLGQGGFGAVYKGQLANGQEIAVKRLATSSFQGDLEFKNEVMVLARLTHRNLVMLRGFSVQESEKLLVYEFLPNGSLDQFIFESTIPLHLDWDQCYKIIRGITKGLLYLHEDSQMRIIHRDLKPSNVLLDGQMSPKIADFGLARLFVPDVTHGSTKRIVGTYGYMAPEYAIQGHFSIKSDVFSFGVLVLEIISGRKNISTRDCANVEGLLISVAWKNWRDGTPGSVINPVLMTNSGTLHLQEILRCIQIGLLCVQENAAARPTMASILLMLSSETISIPLPTKPAYFLPLEYDLEVMDITSDERDPSSTNDASITELNPR